MPPIYEESNLVKKLFLSTTSQSLNKRNTPIHMNRCVLTFQYSLPIAAQSLSFMPFGNLLHNPTIRVTIQAIQNDPCLVSEMFAERSNRHG